MLRSHICQVIQSCLFPSRFLTKTLYAFLLLHECQRPAHHILVKCIILIISCEKHKFCKSSLLRFLQPPVTSCLQVQITPQQCFATFPLLQETNFFMSIKIKRKNYESVFLMLRIYMVNGKTEFCTH